MRIFVKLYDKGGRETETHVIACHDASTTISSLKQEVLQRLGSDADGEQFRLALAGNGAKLCETDAIEGVLRDGDYLCLCPAGVPRSEARNPDTLPSYGHAICQALIKTRTAEWIELDGNSLEVEDLMKIGRGQYRVKLSDASAQAVCRAREVVDDIVNNHRVVYGITTGFGKFSQVVIPSEKLVELQESLIRSHSAGVGSPLSPEQTRRVIALRINVLAKAFSGVRLETLQQLVDALNASCLPYIPEQGTVGASGDLAPLSHLALGMMGEGKMWSPETGWDDAKWVLEAHGLKPIILAAKEGICLINGTQLITALGAEALFLADMVARQADVIAALSLDVLQGTPRAFDYDIHSSRPHPGQQVVAARLRALLDSEVHPSEIRAGHRGCSRVQDPYTLRCIPQVHGVVGDTINFVRGILTTEMNSALDNPMVFTERREVISGGNFHGEYPAKALDYLAIGVHELANMSERRLERLVNPAYSDLPAFLVKEGGLHSGFMLAHCTAASLVSENKVLTHPSSVDSISTSAAQEDHVSMGGYAARKALQVVRHVEQVLAIELLAACQALEYHRPKKTTAPLEEVYHLLRSVVRPWDKDRFMAPDIEAATTLLREGKVWEAVRPYIKSYREQAVEPPAAKLQIVDQHKNC